MGLRARVTFDGGGAPTVFDALLSAVCTRARTPARRPSASVCVYLYRNTAFGFPYSPATQISEGLTQRYTFQGREASAHSAAGAPMYYRFRMYEARLGRFDRRDPMLGGDRLYNAYGFPGSRAVMYGDAIGFGGDIPQQLIEEKSQRLRDAAKSSAYYLNRVYGGEVRDVTRRLELVQKLLQNSTATLASLKAEEREAFRQASKTSSWEPGHDEAVEKWRTLSYDLDYVTSLSEKDFDARYAESRALETQLWKAQRAYQAAAVREAKHARDLEKEFDKHYKGYTKAEGCYTRNDLGKRRRFEWGECQYGTFYKYPQWLKQQTEPFETVGTIVKFVSFVKPLKAVVKKVSGIDTLLLDDPVQALRNALAEEQEMERRAYGLYLFVRASYEECTCKDAKDTNPQWRRVSVPKDKNQWVILLPRVDSVPEGSWEQNAEKIKEGWMKETMKMSETLFP